MSAPSIASGRMRHRVAVERPRETTSSTGEVSLAWDEVAVRWAEVAPLSGRELTQARAVLALTTHRVRLRPVEGLTARARLVMSASGRILQIESVRDIEERGAVVECDCVEEPTA